MPEPSLWDMLLKLIVSVLVGGLIGVERETHGRPAGLRTHILVCLGSTLFGLCSYTIAGNRFDPGRISAQIVTGIGFLGAGTIMRQGSVVRGLTTAASIWTVAAIGLAVAVGGDMLLVALAASILVVATLNLIPHFERRVLQKGSERVLNITLAPGIEPTCNALGVLSSCGARVRVLGSEETPDGARQVLRVRVRLPDSFDEAMFDNEIRSQKGVFGYSWE
ncbi:MAG: MgtC/SapB family protein [Armatimonadota bacterium]|nr:MgtC/SapB family protein [Armatimonadota bacterium]